VHDSAYHFLIQAVTLHLKNDDLWGLSKSYHALATVYNRLDSLPEAEATFLKAIDINHTLDNTHALASNYYSFAYTYRAIGLEKQELEYLQKAKILEDTYTDEELKSKVSSSYNLFLVNEWNAEIGAQLRKSFNSKDSIYSARLNGRVLELQEEYEADKRRQELVIKNLQITEQQRVANQRERLIWGLAVLLFMLIFFGLLFVRYRAKLSKLTAQQRLASERTRISRDLHDNIGARITAMSTRIDLLDDSENRVSELDKIRSEASDTVSMLRDTIWAMHREEFSVPQFMTRIVQYANQTLPESIEVHSSFDPKLENSFLNSSQALNLFRIAQEAIQNSMKHSEASQLQITFKCISEHYEFSISDNGTGRDKKPADSDECYGLQNIRERAAEIDGSVEFVSENEDGFHVHVSF
jgi:signal transduction histidine kinase